MSSGWVQDEFRMSSGWVQDDFFPKLASAFVFSTVSHLSKTAGKLYNKQDTFGTVQYGTVSYRSQ